MSVDAPWVAELVERLEELASVPDAARAEAWVSGLFGELRDASMEAGNDLDDLGVVLLSALSSSYTSEALGVSLVASNFPDAELKAAAMAACAELEAQLVEPPPWADAVASFTAEQAWIVERAQTGPSEIERLSSTRTLVIEFAAQVADHCVLVELTHDNQLVDLHLGAAGLVDDVFAGDDDDATPLVVAATSVDDAVALVRHALQRGPVQVTDGIVLNHLVVAVRFGLSVSSHLLADSETASGARETLGRGVERDETDDDAAAVEVLVSALRAYRSAPAPDGALDAATALASRLVDGEPALVSLGSVAGVSSRSTRGIELLVRLAGAYVSPADLSHHPRDERELILALEWADWLGAVIELVRGGAGSSVRPAELVRAINRCDEVATTIRPRDAPRVEAGFALTLEAWELTGVVDHEHRLTGLGSWVLPRALAAAWCGSFDP